MAAARSAHALPAIAPTRRHAPTRADARAAAPRASGEAGTDLSLLRQQTTTLPKRTSCTASAQHLGARAKAAAALHALRRCCRVAKGGQNGRDSQRRSEQQGGFSKSRKSEKKEKKHVRRTCESASDRLGGGQLVVTVVLFCFCFLFCFLFLFFRRL